MVMGPAGMGCGRKLDSSGNFIFPLYAAEMRFGSLLGNLKNYWHWKLGRRLCSLGGIWAKFLLQELPTAI